jgi:hypothetical protein
MVDVRIVDKKTGVNKPKVLTGEEVGASGKRPAHVIILDSNGNSLGGTILGNLKIVTDDIVSGDLTLNAYTFTDDVDAVAIKNDGTSDLTITISTLLFTIKPGESRILELAAFDTVTFSAGAVFRLNGLQRS